MRYEVRLMALGFLIHDTQTGDAIATGDGIHGVWYSRHRAEAEAKRLNEAS